MMATPGRRAGLARGLMPIAALLLCAAGASAQTTTQLWANLTIDWVKSNRLVYELDLEPKVLIAGPEGQPAWRNLDVTPNVEYSLKPWLDLVGDVTVGRTMQTDDVDSTEVTPRIGARFHLFSRRAILHAREQAPQRRIVVRELVRFESRNFFYSGGDLENESTYRFRNRLEVLMPIDKPSIADDGAKYWLADWEWFIPLDDAEERFASRQRVRAGIGYRRNFNWRFEALYIWTRSRDTLDSGFSTNENIIDIRVKRVF